MFPIIQTCLWCLPWIKRNGFLLSLLWFTISGYALGILLKSQNFSSHTIYLIGFPGQLILRAFLMIIVPLLFCSLVIGVSSFQKGADARMMIMTLVFFCALSTLSAILGGIAGHIIHPGKNITSTSIKTKTFFSGSSDVILDSVLDLLWNMIPSNVLAATFSVEYTHMELMNFTHEQNGNNTELVYNKSMRKKDGVNFMGLLFFSTIFGCALASLGDKGDALRQVIEQLNAVIMKIMSYFLKFLPIAMFFWMFKEGLVSIAPVLMLQYTGAFLATVMGCIIFHQFILLPVLYLIIVRRNPIRFHLNLLPSILTAFGTSSSAATLPVTVKCAEEVNRIHKSVTSFVLPLGMVVHKNGSVFYKPLVAVFLTQLEGIELSVGETFIAGMTSFLLSIAAPGIVSGGNPVYILTVMASAGINKPKFISLVLSLDWFTDRLRTIMNVVGDSYVAAFVEKLCEKNLLVDEENEVSAIKNKDHATDNIIDQVSTKTTLLCKNCHDVLKTN